ncbi:uncharacterized protein METZ01_LOCUS479667, partial [marine metagenome]
RGVDQGSYLPKKPKDDGLFVFLTWAERRLFITKASSEKSSCRMGKVLYIPLRLTRRVNVSAVVSIYKHLTLYSLNYPRRGCRLLQLGPSGFFLSSGLFYVSKN